MPDMNTAGSGPESSGRMSGNLGAGPARIRCAYNIIYAGWAGVFTLPAGPEFLRCRLGRCFYAAGWAGVFTGSRISGRIENT